MLRCHRALCIGMRGLLQKFPISLYSSIEYRTHRSFSVPVNYFTREMSIKYPTPRRDESVIEVLHGQKVADPYRWLEDPDSSETKEWVDQQNSLTESFLKKAENERPQIENTIKNLLDYDKFSCGWKIGDYFYYSHHAGLANQAVLMQSKSIDEEARVFLDPNKMSTDGTVSLGTTSWSENGQYIAYGIQRSGSDWEEIHVMDCNTLQPGGEVLEWVKFTSVAWTHDGKGFYYCRYAPPQSLKGISDKEKRGAETDQADNQMVYYHRVGTLQAEDRLVYSDPANPKRMYSFSVSCDGKYLILYPEEDCTPENQLWYVDLSKDFGKEAESLTKFIDQSYKSSFHYITNDDDGFYLKTNWKASRNRLIKGSLTTPVEQWKEVIPEHETNVLSSIHAVNFDQLGVVYMTDAHDTFSIHELKSGQKLYDIDLPDIGSVGFTARREQNFLMYKFSSFLYPGNVYYVDLTLPIHDGVRLFRQMSPKGFNATKYGTEQVFYTSKDGTTKVPMFIIRPRDEVGLTKTTKRPCLLYGYGGFMISLTPYYSARWTSWLECMGGIVVVANIRGGAEYGREWHQQGILDKKQNVFDDFQWAAKHLNENMQITEPQKLMIMGGSNGGLLVGACINQAPELYGAAVAQVGVMDLFRFHKFTIGSAWVSDFGNPDKKEHFDFQQKISPLHNVFSPERKECSYPAVLLTTADHDDRVVPLHTYKFGAELQHVAGNSKLQEEKPLLLRIDVKAGHGGGKPTSKVIEEITDTLLFATLTLQV